MTTRPAANPQPASGGAGLGNGQQATGPPAPTAAPGYAAFTNYGLVPHADGSGQARPPGLLVLSCLRAAPRGGEATVADGLEIAALAASCPRLFTALCLPQAACFGGPDGYAGPAFAAAGEDRMTIRLRLDDLVLFSLKVQEALPQLGGHPPGRRHERAFDSVLVPRS
jgi:hypothetical protein